MFINTSGLVATFAYIYCLLSVFSAQFNPRPAVLPTGKTLYLFK